MAGSRGHKESRRVSAGEHLDTASEACRAPPLDSYSASQSLLITGDQVADTKRRRVANRPVILAPPVGCEFDANHSYVALPARTQHNSVRN